MPLYEYRCECGHTRTQQRPVSRRNGICLHWECPLGASEELPGRQMTRVIGNCQIIANPTHLREENRLPGGFSDKDVVEMRKQDDRDYEAGWEGKNPSLAPVESMHDTYHNITRDQVEHHLAELAAGGDD